MAAKNLSDFRHLLQKYYHLMFFLGSLLVVFSLWFYYQGLTNNLQSNLAKVKAEKSILGKNLQITQNELNSLKNQDQYKINKTLRVEIDSIQKTYTKAVDSYEKLLDLKAISKPPAEFDNLLTKSLVFLSQKNYASASASLLMLDESIQKERDKLAASFVIPTNLPTDNQPPNSGFKQQQVSVDGQNFLVDIIAADLNSTKVIVDTASDSDCKDNCPVLSLADYVSRSGAYAGVNGSYFCPATYPTCADKKNSFDTLLMNKNKKYFNSDNNVYSVIPAIIISGTNIRYVNKSLEWGRDTGVDAVIANYPLLSSDGQVVFGGSSGPKINNKSSRSFVGSTGSTIYIGVVFNASTAETANVLKTLGLRFALNLDDGGSTALWFSGYKAGPGRNIPNAILFLKK
ncbi:phosphodiester glycosidase family protein [Candidatus Gottesmanbacteria bacterium]|nr:phosphodiester glycosidase family protein [Candidatus Gottesmanbacteria bacterium]